MRRSLITLAAAAILATSAGADTIYLRDKTLEGKATTVGDKVIIELSTGGKVEVDAKDILHIYKRDSGTPASATSAASAPIDPLLGIATRPASGAGLPTASTPLGATSTIDVENVTRPESMVFAVMRNLSATPVGAASFELRKQLEQWRESVHDRKRKVGPNWIAPKEYILSRAAYDEGLKEAQTLVSKVRSAKAGTQAEKDALALLRAKLRTAALTWRDPTLRTFLLAVSDCQGGSYLPAYTQFQDLRRQYPYVAGFAQGEAMSLVGLDRATESLAPAMDFMRLRSDTFEAYDLLKDAMSKVPGAETKNPPYLAAKDLLGQYQLSSSGNPSSSKIVNCLMPGKPWASRDDMTLPVPPCDRLIVRQAVAVPVADNMLIVDAQAVTDAMDVVVRIDPKTYVQATVKKLSTTGKTVLPPLAIVTLTSHSFSPPTANEPIDSFKDKDVTVSGLGTYPELGAGVRQAKVKLRMTDDGAVRLGSSLLPGEATAPVLADNGQLIAFVTGRTDVQAEGGGDEKLITHGEISQVIKAGKSGSSVSSYGKVKRTANPTATKAATFIVYGLFGEKFADK